MAGLLDIFNTYEGQQGLGLLAAAGARSDGASFGQRLQEGLGSAEKWKDADIKRKMMILQEKRAQSAFDMQKDAYASIPGAGLTSLTPSSGGGTATTGGSIGGVGGQGGGDTNAQLVRLEKMAIAGVPGAKEAFEIFKYRSDPQQLQPGTFSQNRVTGEREYIPDVKTGIGYGKSGMYGLAGSSVIAELEGQKQAAIEQAKAGVDIVEVPDGQGGTQKMPRSQALNLLKRPQAAPAPAGYASEPQMRATASGPMGATAQDVQRELAATTADLKKTLDPSSRKLLQDHITEMTRQLGNMPESTPTAAPKWGASLTNAQKDTNEQQQARALETIKTGAKAGADRIMGGYDNARSAVDTLTSTAEARKSIVGGSFVGTGAETMLAISKGLQGMGFQVSPEQTANTDYLQSTLGQGILNKAKTLGANPTDNDARIIRSIVGSIGTDPQALNKLLDYQDVMAHRAIDSHNKNYTDAKSRGFDAGFDLTVDKPKASSASPMTVLPTANTSNKGRKIRDTETGKILTSNGLSWVEAK